MRPPGGVRARQRMKRIFVVGYPRSGTTLMQAVLACHPRLVSFPETHYLAAFAERNPLRRWIRHNRRIQHQRLRRAFAAHGLAGAFDSLAATRGVRGVPGELVEYLDWLADHLGYGGWVEKTPRHLRAAAHFEEWFDYTAVIHVLREPAAAIGSYLAATAGYPGAWRGRVGLRFAVRRWNAELELTRACMERPRHHVVRYEDLVRAPEDEARRLCTALGLEFTPAMLHPESAYETIVRPDEHWKQRNAQPSFTAGTGARRLTPAQADYVARHALPLGHVLGHASAGGG